MVRGQGIDLGVGDLGLRKVRGIGGVEDRRHGDRDKQGLGGEGG